MKIKAETISRDNCQSYNLMYNPRLSHLFFWHFHPEYELVYIKGPNGTRHVGNHISTYEGGDLVLIGSNIPHLNFDYGVKLDYKQVVLHLQTDFIKQNIQLIPELKSISKLFNWAQFGVAFTGHIKDEIGERLYDIDKLIGFQQFVELLSILNVLAETKEFELLHDAPYRNQYNLKEQERLRNIHAYIDKNYQYKIKLDEVASLSNMSKEAFCRYFKKITGTTFIEFLNQYRISQSKRLLMSGVGVSETCFDCGFESLSYFNRVFKKITNETPSTFRGKYK